MKSINKILGGLYLSYFLLLFILSMLPVYLCVLWIAKYKEPLRSQKLHKIFKAWMGFVMPFAFCPVKRKGEEHFKENENYLVLINHQSFMDIPVSSPWIPGPNKTLAKIEIAKVPLFGTIYRMGSILVNRKDEKSRKASIHHMRQALQMGLHLCLYPEGTRNTNEKQLGAFQDGAFLVAIREQKPIIPALIFNTRKILHPKHTFYARPSVIHFHFLEPISTIGLSIKDILSLKEQVWNIMNSYYIAQKDQL